MSDNDKDQVFRGSVSVNPGHGGLPTRCAACGERVHQFVSAEEFSVQPYASDTSQRSASVLFRAEPCGHEVPVTVRVDPA